MKKLLQVVTAAVLGTMFMGSFVSATSDCSIYQTGSSSYNSCTINKNQNVQATCDNSIYVINNNSQNAGTGTANNSSNTNGGSATTGDAVNENGQNVTLGSSCGATPTPTPSQTPVTPAGMGGAGGAGQTPAQPASLPYTAGASAETIVVASLVAAAAIVALSRVAVAAYRRFSVK